MLNLFNIKSKAVLSLAGIVLMASMVSCRDEDNDSTATVTEADAVNAIESSVATSSNGMAKTMSDASVVATVQAPNLNCNQEYTTEYDLANSGANYSYDYSGTRTYELTCSTGAASFSYTAALQGTYDTPRMYSDDSATSDFNITGLSSSETTTVFNGSHVRNGYQESKVLQMRHFNSVLTYTLNNVTLNKATQKIVSGTASVTFVGTGSGGNTYTYNGSITFNGNDTATVVINGTTHIINL